MLAAQNVLKPAGYTRDMHKHPAAALLIGALHSGRRLQLRQVWTAGDNWRERRFSLCQYMRADEVVYDISCAVAHLSKAAA